MIRQKGMKEQKCKNILEIIENHSN